MHSGSGNPYGSVDCLFYDFQVFTCSKETATFSAREGGRAIVVTACGQVDGHLLMGGVCREFVDGPSLVYAQHEFFSLVLIHQLQGPSSLVTPPSRPPPRS